MFLRGNPILSITNSKLRRGRHSAELAAKHRMWGDWKLIPCGSRHDRRFSTRQTQVRRATPLRERLPITGLAGLHDLSHRGENQHLGSARGDPCEVVLVFHSPFTHFLGGSLTGRAGRPSNLWRTGLAAGRERHSCEGARAARFGFPSRVHGVPGVGSLIHRAARGLPMAIAPRSLTP